MQETTLTETPQETKSEESTAPPEPFTTPPQQEETPEETPAQPAETPDVYETLGGLEELDHEKVLGLERLKPHLEERDEGNYSRGVLEGRATSVTLLDERSDLVKKGIQGMESVLGRLNKAAKAANLDEAAIDNLLADHGATFQALNQLLGEEVKGEARVEGYNAIIEALATEMSEPGLAHEFSARLKLHLRGSKDEKLVPDLLKRIVGKAKKESYDKGFTEGKAANKKAADLKEKTATRSNEGPNTAPSTPGGGKPTPEQWAAMGTVERNKARAEGKGPTD